MAFSRKISQLPAGVAGEGRCCLPAAMLAARRAFMLAAGFCAHAHVAAECGPCIEASGQVPWRDS